MEERNWLARTGFRLLVPLIGSQGSLVGLIALGRKKSELPFSGEDQLLLSTIAASAALGLESRLIAASPEADWPTPPQRQPDRGAPFTQSTPGDERAVECQVCHRIEPPSREHCSACDGALEPTGLPYVLLGKFRFEQRIGKGGMGVVYRAVDLALGRTVAIKTLPKISPEFAARLRQEARAMASVVHPNLALIYGVETWRQTPLLVVELLEGGTLAARLNKQALDLQEAIELGMTLAQVLEKMHAVGMLHRDIKPSNVGYAADGSPKLRDLGLAKILDDSRRMGFPVEGSTLDELDSLPNSKLTSLTVTRRVVGTPIYLSPEAARGDGPSPSFDLWSLSVVLFEAITGHHPLSIDQMLGLRERILRGDVDDIRGHLPVCPTALALFFDDALSAEPSRRPATAGDFIARLEAMQDLL